MLLLKPCHGQIDAPRGWYLEAVERLIKMGLRQHALDPCAFLVFELDDSNYDANDPIYEIVNSFGEHRMVGIIIMHVDDLLGAGCYNNPRYQAVVEMLKHNFSFREWKEEQPVLEYCGFKLEKIESGGRKLHETKYLEKMKPINYDKKCFGIDILKEREITIAWSAGLISMANGSDITEFAV